MKVHVCFVQNDVLNHETKTAADGVGLLNEDHLLYFEDDKKAKHAITFTSEGVILERIAEVSSRTILRYGEQGECSVNSPYGAMHFTSQLQFSEKRDSCWKVHYSIFSEEEKVSEMELEWKFEKLA